jgi:tRNA pseudouridine55 synthase
VDGVLLVDKPAGRTSHDVVAEVRRARGGRRAARVGHAGTLDPFATGLLLVLLGRATRAQRFLMDLPKTYEAVARFGAVSTTGDPEGVITETGTPVPDPLVLPTGEITQRPPAFSAIKVGGRRAYDLARRGEAVEVPERTVTVYAFERRWREGDRVGLHVECSSGTYVRSLVADLGDAYCVELRRTAIGPFSVEDADPDRVVPLGDALERVLPVVRLTGDAARRAAHGQPVAAPAPVRAGATLLVDEAGPIAVAHPREDEMLKPTVGFRPA